MVAGGENGICCGLLMIDNGDNLVGFPLASERLDLAHRAHNGGRWPLSVARFEFGNPPTGPPRGLGGFCSGKWGVYVGFS